MSLNLACFLGGLEYGWYLHIRQALAGAAGRAVHSPHKNNVLSVGNIYLQGMDLPQSLIDSVVIDFPPATPIVPGGVKFQQITLSVPLSKTLLFGGVPSTLFSSNPDSKVIKSGVCSSILRSENPGICSLLEHTHDA